MPTGLYINFEGVVASGKTTQSKKLVDYLKQKYPNREIIWTREPGGSEIADAIRNVVQVLPFKETMDPICEAYLFGASRAHTLRTIVKPALERGAIVVADRSFLSSAAIQGEGRKIGIPKILKIMKVAVGDTIPDLILYIKLDLKVALNRVIDKSGDKFEHEKIGFYKRVARGYEKLKKHKLFKDRWIDINGEGNVDEVFELIKNAVEERINNA